MKYKIGDIIIPNGPSDYAYGEIVSLRNSGEYTQVKFTDSGDFRCYCYKWLDTKELSKYYDTQVQRDIKSLFSHET